MFWQWQFYKVDFLALAACKEHMAVIMGVLITSMRQSSITFTVKILWHPVTGTHLLWGYYFQITARYRGKQMCLAGFTLHCCVRVWFASGSVCSLMQKWRPKLLPPELKWLGASFRRSNCNWNIYVRDFLSGCTAPYHSIWCQNMSRFYNIYKPVFVKYPCSHILHIHIHVANCWLLQHIYISVVVSLGCLLLSKTRIIWVFMAHCSSLSSLHGKFDEHFTKMIKQCLNGRPSAKLRYCVFRWHFRSVIKVIWLQEDF